MDQIRLFGIDIVNSTTARVLDYIQEVLDSENADPVSIVFINAHGVNLMHENPAYREALSHADWILNDGVGLDIAASLQGHRFQENLNGTDLMPRVVACCAERGDCVYFLGTTPVRLEKAVANLIARDSGLCVAGFRDGFFDDLASEEIVRAVNKANADVLLVALGNPKQEIWIRDHIAELNVKLVFAVGAYIDFESGEIMRAPQFVQSLRLEWLFRLLQEPRRLWNRYIIGNVKFLYRATMRTVP